MGERVMCVNWQGVYSVFGYMPTIPVAVGIGGIQRLCAAGRSSFLKGVRPDVETDESIKQLVTYIVISGNKAPEGLDNTKFVTYRRSAKSEEARLHARRSIGIGGHVGWPSDIDLFAVFGSNQGMYSYLHSEAMRELTEELHSDFIPTSIGLVPWGVIYDPRDDVGRVHLGIVFVLPVDAGDYSIRCDSIEDVQSESLRSLRLPDRYGLYESWSQVVLDKLM